MRDVAWDGCFQFEVCHIFCFARLHELSEWKGHSGGTRVLNEHASV